MLYFIHGLNGSADSWNDFIEFFTRKDFQCEAIELKEGINLKKAHFIDYVNKVITLVSEDDILIGQSMGGLIMQKVAEQTSIKAGIGLCSASPAGIPMNKIPWWRQLRYIPNIIAGIPFKPSFSLIKEIFINGIDEKYQREIYQQLQPQSVHVTWEVMKQKVTIDEQNVHCPLFFIGRRDDHTIPVDVTKKLAKKYHAPYQIIDGNHYIFHDWKKTAEIILAFIRKIEVKN
jgi:pimeloyl-ACP methyl ester carboxylesterase